MLSKSDPGGSFFSLATPPKPPQATAPTGNHVLKCPRLSGTFLRQHSLPVRVPRLRASCRIEINANGFGYDPYGFRLGRVLLWFCITLYCVGG